MKSFNSTYIEDKQSFIQKLDDIYKSNLDPRIVKFQILVNDQNNANVNVLRPFINGDNLEELLASNTNHNLFMIWHKIVELYHSLHTNGIYPNIVKLTNLFVSSDNNVKLVGIHPRTSSTFGAFATPTAKDFAFFAPEIFTHNYEFSEKTDMWSLGALLIYLYKQSLPWSTINVCMMIKQISNLDFRIFDDLPKYVKFIAEHLICLIPDQRLDADQVLRQHANVRIPAWKLSMIRPKRNSLTARHSIICQGTGIFSQNVNVRSTKALPHARASVGKPDTFAEVIKY